MRCATYTPAWPLSDCVDLFWLYEDYVQPHAFERLLPMGCMELVISLSHESSQVYNRDKPDQYTSFRGGLIAGAHSGYSIIDTASQRTMIGVHFKPGGAFPFLGLPAGELLDTDVGLATLWGGAASDLREQLLAVPTPAAKFRVLEQTLLARATWPLTRHPAVAFALAELQHVPHTRTLGAITAQIGLSPRRFSQVFSQAVGLTPKLFCRIQRFQAALRRVHNGQSVEWAAVALDCGYFDQAHFIHDFRAFAGINPTTYLAQRSPHLNHVPLPT